jgi:hypothetical protein
VLVAARDRWSSFTNPAESKWLGAVGHLDLFSAILELLFDGSQDWVIAHNDVVAGSSPAFGFVSTCTASAARPDAGVAQR